MLKPITRRPSACISGPAARYCRLPSTCPSLTRRRRYFCKLLQRASTSLRPRDPKRRRSPEYPWSAVPLSSLQGPQPFIPLLTPASRAPQFVVECSDYGRHRTIDSLTHRPPCRHEAKARLSHRNRAQSPLTEKRQLYARIGPRGTSNLIPAACQNRTRGEPSTQQPYLQMPPRRLRPDVQAAFRMTSCLWRSTYRHSSARIASRVD